MTSVNEFPFADSAWQMRRVEAVAHGQLLLDLYDREQASLRRYLMFLGVDADTAAETTQETFLKLHQHLLGGGDRTNLRAWLFRVAHNLARNSQLSFRSSRTTSLSDATVVVNPVAPNASAEDVLIAKERETRLAQAIEELSTSQKSCLALRSQGLKYREIAEALQLSVSTVAENVQRGLERLREKL